jgi:Flp pilus assembly protein TadB
MTDSPSKAPAEDLSSRPTGELVKQMTEQLSALVREELRLAQLEMTEKGKRAGKGAGLLGGAAVVVLLALGALVAAAVAALSLTLPVWVSALIVAVVLLLLAGLLALSGRKQLHRALPAAPRQAVDSVKTDVETLKDRARS